MGVGSRARRRENLSGGERSLGLLLRHRETEPEKNRCQSGPVAASRTKRTCRPPGETAEEPSKSKHLARTAALARALQFPFTGGLERIEEGKMQRKRKMQMSFTRVWISEKDANRQLVWTIFCSLTVLALTIVSTLRA